MSALDKQTGGNHYKRFAIQPIEFTMKNNLGFIEGNIIKYVSRHKFKNGAEDIEKVKHYAELLLELEYGQKLQSELPIEDNNHEELSLSKLANFVATHPKFGIVFKAIINQALSIDPAQTEILINEAVNFWQKNDPTLSTLLDIRLKED